LVGPVQSDVPSALPQILVLIRTGLRPGVKCTGEFENRFNGFCCVSTCSSLYSIDQPLNSEVKNVKTVLGFSTASCRRAEAPL